MTDQPEAKSDSSKGKTGPLEQPADALKMADLSKSAADTEPPSDSAQPTNDYPATSESQEASNPHPASGDAQPSNEPQGGITAAQPAAANDEPSGSATVGPAGAPPSNTDSSSMPRLAGSTSDKGKDPEVPPPPPAKNDEPTTAPNDGEPAAAPAKNDEAPAAKNTEPAAKGDESSDAAIGEASAEVARAGGSGSRGDGGPVCVITLLVPSGKKHPYKLSEKYLTRRGVTIPGMTLSGHKDVLSISVYTLKELILREWRDDWEPAPPSPTQIRLISFGHIMSDKHQINRELAALQFDILSFVPVLGRR